MDQIVDQREIQRLLSIPQRINLDLLKKVFSSIGHLFQFPRGLTKRLYCVNTTLLKELFQFPRGLTCSYSTAERLRLLLFQFPRGLTLDCGGNRGLIDSLVFQFPRGLTRIAQLELQVVDIVDFQFPRGLTKPSTKKQGYFLLSLSIPQRINYYFSDKKYGALTYYFQFPRGLTPSGER